VGRPSPSGGTSSTRIRFDGIYSGEVSSQGPQRLRRKLGRPFSPIMQSMIAAVDFFTVPTIAFRNLYCFVALLHDRRQIIPRSMRVVAEPCAVDVRSCHQFEEELGAASSENGLLIAKMEFLVRTAAQTREERAQTHITSDNSPLVAGALLRSERAIAPVKNYRNCRCTRERICIISMSLL
jgi:hypothetical protein